MNSPSSLLLSFLMKGWLSNLISDLMTRYSHFLKHVNQNHLSRLCRNVSAVWIRLNLIRMPKFVNFVAVLFVENAGKRRELFLKKIGRRGVLKSH